MVKIRNISRDDFEGHRIKVDGYSIIECYDNSLGALVIMEPVFNRLRKENDFQFTQLRIDIKKNPHIIECFYVLDMPAYLFFYDGELIDRVEGLISFNVLSGIINDHLSKIKSHN